MENANRVLNSCFSSNTLDCLNHNLLSLLVSIEFGIIHNLIHIACSIEFSLIFQTLNQSLLSLFSTQTRKFFQFSLFLLLHLIKFLLLDRQEFLLVVNTLLILINLHLASTKVFLTLIERNLALFQLILILLDARITLLHFFFEFRLLVEEFLLHFQKLLLFYYFCLFVGSIYHFVIFSLNDITENEIPCSTADNERHKGCYNSYYHYYIYLLIFLFQSVFNLGGKLLKNIIIRFRIIPIRFLLISQCHINERHIQDFLIALSAFENLGI